MTQLSEILFIYLSIFIGLLLKNEKRLMKGKNKLSLKMN